MLYKRQAAVPCLFSCPGKKAANWNLSHGLGYPPVGGGVSVSPAGSVKRFCLAAEASPGGPRRPANHRIQHMLITNDCVVISLYN